VHPVDSYCTAKSLFHLRLSNIKEATYLGILMLVCLVRVR